MCSSDLLGQLIQYALFGTTHKMTRGSIVDLIHWEEDHCIVELDLEHDGETYRIWREMDRLGTSYARLLRLGDDSNSTGEEVAAGVIQVQKEVSRRFQLGATETLHSFYLAERESVTTPEHFRSFLDRVAGIAGRGFLILGTAFAFDPAASWGPFASLIGERTTSPAALSVAQGTGIAALGIGAVLAGSWFARRWRTGDRRGAVMDLVESTLIVTAIALTDPLFGIGVYFLGTHSFRHSVRLAGTPEVMPEGSTGQSLLHRLWTMHLASLPLLVPTFVLVAAWCRLQFGTIDAAGLTVTMLGFFLVTTLPHHLLGLRLPSIRSV